MLYSAVIWSEISFNALSYSALTWASVESPPVNWAAFLNSSKNIDGFLVFNALLNSVNTLSFDRLFNSLLSF